MIEINNIVRADINKKIIKNVLAEIIDILKLKYDDISVVLVSSNQIRKINKKYRQIDKATDVLSFNYSSSRHRIDGEIVICYKVAKEQAWKHDLAISDEINRLLIHGLLHLAGYAHQNKRETSKMGKLEFLIKQTLNSKS